MLEYNDDRRQAALAYFLGNRLINEKQASKIIGCKEAFTRPMFVADWPNADEYNGWSHVTIYDAFYANDVLAIRYKGNWPYWCGIIRGYWACGGITINFKKTC